MDDLTRCFEVLGEEWMGDWSIKEAVDQKIDVGITKPPIQIHVVRRCIEQLIREGVIIKKQNGWVRRVTARESVTMKLFPDVQRKVFECVKGQRFRIYETRHIIPRGTWLQDRTIGELERSVKFLIEEGVLKEDKDGWVETVS